MKQIGMKGTAGQCNGSSTHALSGSTSQSMNHILIRADYGNGPISQAEPIALIASGLRIIYGDVLSQPLPARIGELVSSLAAKESWR